MIKISTEFATTILDKATDFKYFVLLGSFLLFLDSALVLYKQQTLASLSVQTLKTEISLGAISIGVCFFLLFASFISNTLRLVITHIFAKIPQSWHILTFDESPCPFKNNENYIHSDKLLTFAVKTNNQVAFEKYNEWFRQNNDRRLLDYAFLFLLASIFNAIVWFTNGMGFFGIIFELNKGGDIFSVEKLIITLVVALYVSIYYLAIIIGCSANFAQNTSYIRMADHNIQINEDKEQTLKFDE